MLLPVLVTVGGGGDDEEKAQMWNLAWSKTHRTEN